MKEKKMDETIDTLVESDKERRRQRREQLRIGEKRPY